MTTFRVRASSLGEVSAQLNTVLAVFDSHVAAVSAQVESVSGVSWEGQDQEAFDASWQQWKATTVAVRASLTSLSAQLVGAEVAYTATEAGLQHRSVQQRQAETPVVTFSEEVRESVYAGLDRANARQRPSVEQGGMVPAGVTARTGRDQQKVVSTGASALPDASGAGADSDPTPRGRAF